MSWVTEQDRAAANELRDRLKDILNTEYFRSDGFLIRTFRLCDKDVRKTETYLRKSFNWRKELSIDTVLTEETDEYFDTRCTYEFQGQDRRDNPVLIFHSNTWDIRSIVNEGKSAELRKQAYRFGERVVAMVANNQSEDRISSCTCILDAEGSSYRYVGNKEAISFLNHFVGVIRDNYAIFINQVIIINCPRFVSFIFRMIKPLLPALALQRIHFYGTNKAEWQAALLKLIPEDQLSPRYGGTAVVQPDVIM